MDLSALSPSRVNTNKDCELKYFLSYHIRLPEAKASNIYGLKGSAVHESLEYYVNSIRVEQNPELKGELEGKINADYVQTLKDYYAETELWKLDDRQGMRGNKPKGWPHPVEKDCENCRWASKDSICTIAKKPYKIVEGCPRPNFEDELEMAEWTIKDDDGILDKKIIGTEVEFCLEVEGEVLLRGIIDLVVEEDEDTLEIIDYKSGNSTKSYNAALTDPQMRIYSMVAKILWPQYKTYITSLYYIRKKRMVSCVFSKEDDKGTLRSVQNHWNNIRNNKNPRRPNYSFWLCNFCVGHDVCGVIKDNYKTRGRFILPTIKCRHKSTNKCPCWGSLVAENPEEVTAMNTNLMTYTCVGHRKYQLGGEYEQEPDNGETIR